MAGPVRGGCRRTRDLPSSGRRGVRPGAQPSRCLTARFAGRRGRGRSNTCSGFGQHRDYSRRHMAGRSVNGIFAGEKHGTSPAGRPADISGRWRGCHPIDVTTGGRRLAAMDAGAPCRWALGRSVDIVADRRRVATRARHRRFGSIRRAWPSTRPEPSTHSFAAPSTGRRLAKLPGFGRGRREDRSSTAGVGRQPRVRGPRHLACPFIDGV